MLSVLPAKMLGFANVLLFAKYAASKNYTNETQQFKNDSLNHNLPGSKGVNPFAMDYYLPYLIAGLLLK